MKEKGFWRRRQLPTALKLCQHRTGIMRRPMAPVEMGHDSLFMLGAPEVLCWPDWYSSTCSCYCYDGFFDQFVSLFVELNASTHRHTPVGPGKILVCLVS